MIEHAGGDVFKISFTEKDGKRSRSVLHTCKQEVGCVQAQQCQPERAHTDVVMTAPYKQVLTTLVCHEWI